MQKGWELNYVRRVLAATGMSPTALAERAGFSRSTLTRALNDADHKFRLSTSTLDKIRDATGIAYLPDSEVRSENYVLTNRTMIPVPVAATVLGGGGSTGDGKSVQFMAFDIGFLATMTDAGPGDLVMVKVKGHSMEPTLLDDDQVLVDMTKTNLSFDGLFVLQFDDALHVKRIGRSATRGNVLVISDHPAYPELDVAKDSLDVIGRVLWVGRKV